MRNSTRQGILTTPNCNTKLQRCGSASAKATAEPLSSKRRSMRGWACGKKQRIRLPTVPGCGCRRRRTHMWSREDAAVAMDVCGGPGCGCSKRNCVSQSPSKKMFGISQPVGRGGSATDDWDASSVARWKPPASASESSSRSGPGAAADWSEQSDMNGKNKGPVSRDNIAWATEVPPKRNENRHPVQRERGISLGILDLRLLKRLRQQRSGLAAKADGTAFSAPVNGWRTSMRSSPQQLSREIVARQRPGKGQHSKCEWDRLS